MNNELKKVNLLKSRVLPTLMLSEPAKHIVVLMGGISAEYDVSITSAKIVVEQLKALNYMVTPVDMGRDIAQVLMELKPDVVFNCLHGSYGENGAVPGMLEILGVPYTQSGILASSLALDKVMAKAVFTASGLKCPEHVIIEEGQILEVEPMSRPYVIKPIDEGSSIGIQVIFAEDDFNLKDLKFDYGKRMIVERYIPGREIQVAVVNNQAVGTLEIIPKGRFYDYQAKYTDGLATHITPAPIPQDIANKMQAAALKAHEVLGCRGATRAEFRYDDTPGGDGEFYLLEINTHPGMTSLSIVPEIAAHAGISFSDLLTSLINNACLDNEA